MSRTITIADDLYERLDAAARARGLSIDQLLRSWPADDQAAARQNHGADALERVAVLVDELSRRYGEMPDSTELIREDRAR